MSIIQELFTEKFRPKSLADLVTVPRILQEFKQGLTQNFLLYGLPGTGKTSTLFILAKNHTTLYINASDERGIDTIRDKISKFCSTISLEGGTEKMKCVILDEIDGATEEFYKALRAVMERYANTTRFIASCNYLQKLPEPMHSRFHLVSYDPINNEEEQILINEYKKRISKILTAIKVSFTEDTLDKFVCNDFPDMRKLIQKIQSFYNNKITELDPKNFNINYDFKELFNICLNKPDPINNFKHLNEYSTRIDEALAVLGRDFIEYLKNVKPDLINKVPMIIIAVAEYQYQKAFVIDPLITLLACVFKIQQILQ